MSYLGEIRLFAGDFAPAGWALCDGRPLPVAEYDHLFSLIGTSYGGDGTNVFALPNLNARIPVGSGAGEGLDPVTVGRPGGQTRVTLTQAHWPTHTHGYMTSKAEATEENPSGHVLAAVSQGQLYYGPASGTGLAFQSMDPSAVEQAGGIGGSIELGMPSIALTYIICLLGEYPTH